MMVWKLSVFCLFASGCWGQEIKSLNERLRSQKDLPGAIGDLFKTSELDPATSLTLADVFDSSKDEENKFKIDMVMLKHKNTDARYFRHLEKAILATLAVDPPDMLAVNAPSQPSDSFRNWCASAPVSLPLAQCTERYALSPARSIMLAEMSGDKRFIPLFRKCLSVHIYPIWTACVSGLAHLGDRESIPAVAAKIAASGLTLDVLMLVGFDDSLSDQIALELAKADESVLKMIHSVITIRTEERKKKTEGRK